MLKGAAGNIGAQELFRSLEELEPLLASGKDRQLAEAVDKTCGILHNTLKVIDAAAKEPVKAEKKRTLFHLQKKQTKNRI